MITRLASERVNFWSHFAGFLAWLPFTLFLILLAERRLDLIVVSLVYGVGVLFLFFCSAGYHRSKRGENEQTVWRTLDHFAIFVMIAASYTPIVWIWFAEPMRTGVLVLQWGVTMVGLAFKVLVPKAPRSVGPVLYLLMGWVAILSIIPLYQKMPRLAFFELFGGGVFYTVGAVVYALKKPNFRPGVFGFHELFHLFILGGAALHASMVFRSVKAALG